MASILRVVLLFCMLTRTLSTTFDNSFWPPKIFPSADGSLALKKLNTGEKGYSDKTGNACKLTGCKVMEPLCQHGVCTDKAEGDMCVWQCQCYDGWFGHMCELPKPPEVPQLPEKEQKEIEVVIETSTTTTTTTTTTSTTTPSPTTTTTLPTTTTTLPTTTTTLPTTTTTLPTTTTTLPTTSLPTTTSTQTITTTTPTTTTIGTKISPRVSSTTEHESTSDKNLIGSTTATQMVDESTSDSGSPKRADVSSEKTTDQVGLETTTLFYHKTVSTQNAPRKEALSAREIETTTEEKKVPTEITDQYVSSTVKPLVQSTHRNAISQSSESAKNFDKTTSSQKESSSKNLRLEPLTTEVADDSSTARIMKETTTTSPPRPAVPAARIVSSPLPPQLPEEIPVTDSVATESPMLPPGSPYLSSTDTESFLDSSSTKSDLGAAEVVRQSITTESADGRNPVDPQLASSFSSSSSSPVPSSS